MVNNMKKQLVFIIGLCALSHGLFGTPASERIAQKLTNAASQAFGSFKMFDNPIDAQGLSQWDAAIQEGIEIVLNANKKNENSVNKYIMRLINANNELVNTVKASYNSMFAPFAQQQTLPLEEIQRNLEKKARFSSALNKIKYDMEGLKKEVSANRLFKASIGEKDTLIELAYYIAAYAENAIASMDFKFSTENKFSIKRTYAR